MSSKSSAQNARTKIWDSRCRCHPWNPTGASVNGLRSHASHTTASGLDSRYTSTHTQQVLKEQTQWFDGLSNLFGFVDDELIQLHDDISPCSRSLLDSTPRTDSMLCTLQEFRACQTSPALLLLQLSLLHRVDHDLGRVLWRVAAIPLAPIISDSVSEERPIVVECR